MYSSLLIGLGLLLGFIAGCYAMLRVNRPIIESQKAELEAMNRDWVPKEPQLATFIDHTMDHVRPTEEVEESYDFFRE